MKPRDIRSISGRATGGYNPQTHWPSKYNHTDPAKAIKVKDDSHVIFRLTPAMVDFREIELRVAAYLAYNQARSYLLNAPRGFGKSRFYEDDQKLMHVLAWVKTQQLDRATRKKAKKLAMKEGREAAEKFIEQVQFTKARKIMKQNSFALLYGTGVHRLLEKLL